MDLYRSILHRKHPTSNPSLNLSLPLVWHKFGTAMLMVERKKEEMKKKK